MSEEIKNTENTETTETTETTENNPKEELVVYNGLELPKSFVDGINRRVGAETHKWKEKFNQTSEELNVLKSSLEEMRLSQMTEKERLEHEKQKKEEELEHVRKEKEEGFELFKTYKTDTDLYNEISKYDVYNPKQVVKLLKAEYGLDFKKEESGEYNPFFINGEQVFTVQDAVKIFLEDESNSNLLKSTLKSGSGTKTNINQSNKSFQTTFKRSELKNSKSEEAIAYREALRNGIQVNIID